MSLRSASAGSVMAFEIAEFDPAVGCSWLDPLLFNLSNVRPSLLAIPRARVRWIL